MGEVAGIQDVGLASFFGDNNLSVQDVHELVPAENPLELACRAAQQTAGHQLVGGLHQHGPPRLRRSLDDLGGLNRHPGEFTLKGHGFLNR